MTHRGVAYHFVARTLVLVIDIKLQPRRRSWESNHLTNFCRGRRYNQILTGPFHQLGQSWLLGGAVIKVAAQGQEHPDMTTAGKLGQTLDK